MGCHASIKRGGLLIHAIAWMILELDEISEQNQTKKIAVCSVSMKGSTLANEGEGL